MERFPSLRRCLPMACVLVLAWSLPALFARTPSHAASTTHRGTTAPRTRGARIGPEPERFVHFHDEPRASAPHPANRRTAVRTDGGASGRTAAREAAERDARAARLYRSSQVSAPIIRNAKACKRVGAHGESIYENC